MLWSGGLRKASTKRSARHLGRRQQLEHALLALERPDRVGVLGPVRPRAGGWWPRGRAEVGLTIGAQAAGDEVARLVEQGHVLGARTGTRARTSRASATVSHTSSRCGTRAGSPKPSPDRAAAAEGERRGEAGVVDAVEQPPEAVAHPDHPPAGPGRLRRRCPRRARPGSRSCAPEPDLRSRVQAPCEQPTTKPGGR